MEQNISKEMNWFFSWLKKKKKKIFLSSHKYKNSWDIEHLNLNHEGFERVNCKNVLLQI